MKPLVLIPALLITIAATAIPAFSQGGCTNYTCHAPILQVKNIHPPGNVTCNVCHLQTSQEHPVPGGKTYSLSGKEDELCATCHDRFGKKKYLHTPVREGKCHLCHKPHGADGRFLMANDKDQRQLCFGCHDKKGFEQQYRHGPAAVGSCTQCHEPHQSDERALLKKPPRELCLDCHEDFATSIKKAPVVHLPVKEQWCTYCHSPHGSSQPHMMKKVMPDLCLDCHSHIGGKIKEGKVVHKPLAEKESCGICHSSHFSNSPSLLAKDEKSVCLGCHGVSNLGNPPLKNMATELKGKKSLHGPVKGACSVCHDPHGTDHMDMLRGEYPKSFYAPYKDGMYAFCLKCHNGNMLRFDKTTVYTGFRNGDQNLHYLHVVNKRKGRTCRACHEPHAADGEKLTSTEGSNFGKWKIPVDFKKTSTGGSCAPGCHAPFAYDRNKPKANTATGP